MKLTFIDCSCGNTKGFQLADKIAECTSCASLIHVDTPAYHTYEVESLDKIEQRAKEKALEDIHQAIHRELWLEEQLIMGSFDINGDIADWATCFDVQNIEQRVAI